MMDFFANAQSMGHSPTEGLPTSLVRSDMLPRYLILLRHLVLQMSLSLLQHIELLPQIEYGFLGCIFPLLPAITAEPGSPHVDSCYRSPDFITTLLPIFRASRSWRRVGVVEGVGDETYPRTCRLGVGTQSPFNM